MRFRAAYHTGFSFVVYDGEGNIYVAYLPTLARAEHIALALNELESAP